jgi:hypothetical protein
VRKLLCFGIVVFGRYYALPSVVYEMAACSACCIMLLIPVAKGYNNLYIIYNFKTLHVLKYALPSESVGIHIPSVGVTEA